MKTKIIDKIIIANPNDNVGTARAEIAADTAFEGDITAKENIPFGHKMALKHITNGEAVIKYGQLIGTATKDIAPGELVHIHNVAGERGKGR